jgi:hypothetical protein
MFKLLEVKDRYTPLAELPADADALALFDKVRVAKHCTAQPKYDSPDLWLRAAGFNGRSVYVRPCAALRDLMARCNVYGQPVYKDVYLEVATYHSGMCLYMRYQQILGSYMLCALTFDQFQALNGLYNREIGS